MNTQAQGPLAGFRIIDLSMFWAGPLTTEMFAWMGAEVIKVESVQHVDGWRGFGNPTMEKPWERSPVFNGVNLNKVGITLDLTCERGRELLRPFVERADALVENYSPRVMANLGLTDEVLHSWNPRLIIISLPAFGLASPWRDYVGFAPTIEQLSSLPELTGYIDGPPALTGNSLADPSGGFTGALALLAALHAREETSQGVHIDISQLEALTALLGYDIAADYVTGEPPVRRGNRHRALAPQGCYPSAGTDSWLTISISDDAMWRRFAEAIGNSEWLTDERLSDATGRKAHHDELDAAISEWTRARSNIQGAETLQAAAVAAGPVFTPPQLLADAHLKERGFFVELDRDVVGRNPYPGLPFLFSETPGKVYRASPTLGRDNDEVFKEILGMTDDEIAELRKANVIGEELLR
jgi:crotonobetainyl-CoA:carnitine CoA-transferase CaiB-like acyl-CoA transferase